MTTIRETIEFVDELSIGASVVQVCASDASVVNAARVSHADDVAAAFAGRELDGRDEGLINFMLRNGHGSPFEHNLFTFVVEAPIAVVREHHRHRVGHSYNEVSGRYTQLPPRFYVPSSVRVEDPEATSKYGYVRADDDVEDETIETIKESCETAYRRYEDMLAWGVKKEVARGVLPVYTMTRYYWTCNARSLMHFVSLRGQDDAMLEIGIVSVCAERALNDNMPITHEAFVKHGRRAP